MLVKLRSNLYFGRKIKVTEVKVKIKILSVLLPVIIDYDGKYCKVIFCQHTYYHIRKTFEGENFGVSGGKRSIVGNFHGSMLVHYIA